MLCAQHISPSEGDVAGPGSHSEWIAGTLAVLVVAGVAATDYLTSNVNLSILYSLPILLAARTRSRTWMWLLALFVLLLTYLGYFLGPHFQAGSTGWREMIGNYRMVNRTLSAATLLAVAVLAHYWIGLSRHVGPDTHLSGHDPERDTVNEVLHSFEIFGAALICGLIMACIALTDLYSPGEFNFPILYAVPLMICGAARSRSLLWSILPFLLLLTMLGFVLGPKAAHSESVFQSLVTNRFLAAGVQLALAILINVWINERRRIAAGAN